MKTRKNIRDAFYTQADHVTLNSDIDVTALTTYTAHTDNIWVFYTNTSEDKNYKLSFTDAPAEI